MAQYLIGVSYQKLSQNNDSQYRTVLHLNFRYMNQFLNHSVTRHTHGVLHNAIVVSLLHPLSVTEFTNSHLSKESNMPNLHFLCWQCIFQFPICICLGLENPFAAYRFACINFIHRSPHSIFSLAFHPFITIN